MPKINLEGRAEDMLWVNALMHYPNDATLCDRWYRIGGILKRVEGAKDADIIGVTAFTLLQLMEAPSLDALLEVHKARGKRAALAGNLLLSLYLMEKTGIPDPSLGKAFHTLKRHTTSEKAVYADDTKMAASETWHRAQWEEFKPVAHLWAALELNRVHSRYAYAEPDSAFSTIEGFTSFLGTAAAIFKFGCSFIPKRAHPRLSVLDCSKAWTLPPEIPYLDIPEGMRPDSRLVELLRDYQNLSESKSRGTGQQVC